MSRPLTFPTPCDSCDPCKNGKKIPASCIKYTGGETLCLNIPTGTNLNEVIRILDEAICDITSGPGASHFHRVMNAAGVDQFTFAPAEGIRFEGTGGTTVSFDGSINKVIIDSLTAEEVGDILITNNEFITNLGDTLINNETFINNIYDLIGPIFQDTNTIDFTYDSITNIVTADVKISATPNNAILAFSDGIWSPLTFSSGLVYGGEVEWLGTGYDYKIHAAGYYINFQFYQSPDTFVTLDPADPTFDRFDTFIVDTSSTASALTGTPSDNPAEPPLDTAIQLRLGAALVEAGSSQPSVDECLYLDNAEWTSFSSTVRINTNSTNLPCSGTKDIEGTAVITGDYFTLTRGSTLRPYVYQNLTFSIRSKGSWGNKSLSFRWYNGSTPVGNSVTIANNSYGFKSNITSSCQSIVIPVSDFGVGATDLADNLRVTALAPSGSFGWYIDNVCIVAGVIVAPPPATDLIFNNGLTRTGDVVQFGGTLIHDTGLDTDYFTQIFWGRTVQNYPYQFRQYQSFTNSTGIASFTNTADAVTRLGVNFTQHPIRTDGQGGFIPGYNGIGTSDGTSFGHIGYWIGTNGIGWINNPAGRMLAEDLSSKSTGIFFHTKDTTQTDAVTLYGIEASGTGPGEVVENIYNRRILIAHTNKDIELPGYPSTRNDGAATRFLTTDSNGIVKLMDVDVDTAEIVITADNGLTKDTPTNVQLGGTLLHNTTIDSNTFELIITGAVNGNSLDVTNTYSGIIAAISASAPDVSATGIRGVGGNIGVSGSTTGGAGVRASATTGFGLAASATNGIAGDFQVTPSSTNSTKTVISFERFTTGSPANGIGLSLDFGIQSTGGGAYLANQISSVWTDVTHITRTARLEFWGTNSSVTTRKAAITGPGQWIWDMYGDGIFPGTYTYVLGVDANGNVVEIDPGVFGGGGGGLSNAYTAITDGSNSAAASGADTIKFRTGNNLLDIVVGSNDVTHGDNVLYTVNTSNLTEYIQDVVGPFITLNNGLTGTYDDASNTYTGKLGGILLENTVIDASTSYTLSIEGANSSATGILRVVNSSGNGIYVNVAGSNKTGLQSVSAAGIAITALSSGGAFPAINASQQGTGLGINVFTSSGVPIRAATQPTSTNTVVPILQLWRQTTGTPANDIGTSIDFLTNTTVGLDNSNQLISKWTNATDATRTSQFIITGVNSAVTADLFTLSGNGQLKLNKYGSNIFTGTLFKLIGEDSSGNLIEVDASGLGGSVTADNGLHIDSGSGDVYLGGNLLEDTTINGTGKYLVVNTSDSYFDATNANTGSSVINKIRTENSSAFLQSFKSTTGQQTALNVWYLSGSFQSDYNNAGTIDISAFNIQKDKANITSRYSTDNGSTYTGHELDVQSNQISLHHLNIGEELTLLLKKLPNTSTSNVLYYDSTTGQVTYDVASSGGISGITADNGLTASTSTNVQLGGLLLHDTNITSTGSSLKFLDATGGSNFTILEGDATFVGDYGRFIVNEGWSSIEHYDAANNITVSITPNTSSGGVINIQASSGAGASAITVSAPDGITLGNSDGKVYATNLPNTSTSNILYYNSVTGQITYDVAPSGGGSDTNFATNNLTFTANRTHDLNSKVLIIGDSTGNPALYLEEAFQVLGDYYSASHTAYASVNYSGFGDFAYWYQNHRYFLLNPNGGQYTIGDFGSFDNGTFVEVRDIASEIELSNKLIFSGYGINTYAGTPTYALGVDATGNVVEFAVGGGSYTDEQAQDAVGTILADTDSIDATYTDATPEIKFDVKDSYFKVTEIRFIAGYDGALADVGDDTFTLADCDATPMTNKKVILYRNRYRQYDDYDYTYDPSTAEIVLASPLIEGETLIFECHPEYLWTECLSGTPPVGFPYVFPESFG